MPQAPQGGDSRIEGVCVMLPREIARLVDGLPYEINDTGMSGAEVRIYPEYVLKIRPQDRETDYEYEIVSWLQGRLAVPEIAVYTVEDGMAYTLMRRAEGKMLCDAEYLARPELLIRLAAEGIRQLWAVDISACPCQGSRLTERLKTAAERVQQGLADTENVEPETYGPGGFRDPQALLDWLLANRPEEDLVLTHGDYCLPNIFAVGDRISAFIDPGRMGPADRWQDLAITIRSLDHNFNGRYTDGKRLYDFRPEMLLKELGIAFDAEKYRYYLLLDELF